MKRSAKKPLALTRETLRTVEMTELAPVHGGANVQSAVRNGIPYCSAGVNCSLAVCYQPGWH